MHQNLIKPVIFLCLYLLLLVISATIVNDTCLKNGKLGKCVPIAECKQKRNIYFIDEEESKITNETNTNHCSGDSNVCCVTIQRKVGETANKKCIEYLVKQLNSDVIDIRVTGGYDASAKEFPHMAALGYGEWNDIKWGCGGSLISDKFILTAAHCINTAFGPLKYIRLGILKLRGYNMSDYEEGLRDFNVTNTFIHPDYEQTHYNDIALVELNETINLGDSPFIVPACLHTGQTISDSDWIALGWGETSHNGPSADHLQAVELDEAQLEDCKNAFVSLRSKKLMRGIDGETHICAGHGKGDTCQGDSGGPLLYQHLFFGYLIIGITSFGMPCSLTNHPGVYTRVLPYIDWIESIVWQ